jgi:hypothetical protein
MTEKKKVTIFGLGITAFIHWMRDHKFTVAQARYVFRAKGFEIVPKPAPGKLEVRDNTIRPHLHCFPKFCKQKAPKLSAEFTAELMKLKKAAPKDEPVPEGAQKPATAKKAAKAAGKSASKPKVKRSAAKPGKSSKAGTKSLRALLP